MKLRTTLRFIALLLVLYLAQIVLTHLAGHYYFTVLLQGVKAEINAFSDTYEVREIYASWENQRHIVFSKVLRKTPFVDPKGRIYPQALFDNRTMIDGFYVYHLLILPLALAWPYGDWRRRLAGLGLGLFAAALATLGETPFLLFLEWESRLRGVEDSAKYADPLFQFLNTLGGRQFLSLLLASLSIFGACRLFPRRS